MKWVVLALMVGCAPTLFSAPETWDGGQTTGTAGARDDWDTANNWLDNSTPLFNGTEEIIFASSFTNGRTDTDTDGGRSILSLTINTATSFSINNNLNSAALQLYSGNITRTGSGTATLNANLTLGGGAYTGLWNNNNATGKLIVTGAIGQTGGTRALTLTGVGITEFSGVNTYDGLTTVTGGELDLNTATGNSIAANLAIGDNSGADVVKLLRSNQIADTATVTINGTSAAHMGTFNLNGFSDTVGTLAIQGGSLTGAGTVMVKTDYTNAHFGAGNSFNAKGTGSGATINATINAAGTANQSVTGSAVTGSTTATPTLTINIRPGVAGAQSFQVAYGNDATSPTLRGAIQTTGLDAAFTASAADFILANGGNSAAQTVGFNRATAGQTTSALSIQNNFDDVQDQTLQLVGKAWDYAQATLGSGTVDFGNVHVGVATVRNVTVTNTALTNPSFQDRLDGAVSGTSGDITASGSFNNLAAGASSSTLTFTLNAASAGAIGGSKLLTLTSNNSLSGLEVADRSQSVSFTGTAFNLAATSFTGPTLHFANYHVGDTVTAQTLSIANTAPAGAFTEKLDASFGIATGGVTGSGTINLLDAGAPASTAMSVNISTMTAGAKAGTIAVNLLSNGSGTSGLGTTSLGSPTVTVTGGDVYRLAAANALSTPVNLGNVHVGDSFTSQAVTIQNTATNDGYSEKLNATFTGATGDATASGSVNLLTAGVSNNTSLQVGLSGTGTAGAKSGTATVGLVSDGAGTSDLGTTALSSQLIAVQGGVYNYAATGFTGATLHFANYHVGDSVASQALSIANMAPAGVYTEALDASFGVPTQAGITTSGTISLLAPEAGASTALQVGLNTATAGSKAGTVAVQFASNGAGSSGLGSSSLGSQTVTVTGGNVYRLAAANAVTTPINLGSIHVGGSFTAATVTLQNTAANDGFSEKLDAAFGAATGSAFGSGAVDLLAAGAVNGSALTVGLSDTTVGAKTGTIALHLTSNGTGSSGLGITALAPQLLTVQGTVYSGQGVWNATGNGNWSDAARWTAQGGAPGLDGALSAGDTATFGAAITGDRTVNLNGANPTLAGLTFQNALHSYTIAAGSGGAIHLNGAVTADVTGSHRISAPLTGGSLVKTGAGVLTVSGDNSYSGGTTIQDGQITLGHTGGLGTGGLTMTGGALEFSLANTTIAVANLAGSGGTVNYTPGGNNATTLSVGADNSSTTFGGTLDDPGTGQRRLHVTKTGAGTWTLTGANDYNGLTTVNAGALNVRHGSALGNTVGGTTVAAGAALEVQNNIVIAGEALTLNGAGIANGGALRNVAGHNSSTGAITLGSATRIHADAGQLTLGAINGPFHVTFGGAGDTLVTGDATTGSLTKEGTGRLTMSGVTTATGGIQVNGGTLVVNGTVAAGGGSVSVNSGGTLAGSGTFFRDVIVNSGGTLSPGTSPGTTTMSGAGNDLSWLGNGNYNWQLLDATGAAGTGYDTYDLIDGSILDLSGLSSLNPFHLNLWSLSALLPDVSGPVLNFDNQQTYTWTLVSSATPITNFDPDYFAIHVGAHNGTAGFANPLGGGNFHVLLADGDTDLVLRFTAQANESPLQTPEPGILPLLALGALLVRRCRRRRV